MFINNKYTRWYEELCQSRQPLSRVKGGDTYYERHHVIPKCMGGDNSKNNLVLLTGREHFLAHWLLSKMCISTEHHIKMNDALLRLAGNTRGHYKYSKWEYEKAKQKKSKAMKLRAEQGMSPNQGNKHSLDTKLRMSIAKLGKSRPDLTAEARGKRTHTPEARSRVSASLMGHLVSDETRQILSAALKGKAQNKMKSVCLYCGNENYVTQIKRYHNDNCKKKAA